MPGTVEEENEGQMSGLRGYAEPAVGLQEASGPLPYLRTRNALKIILDLDQNFGRPRQPKTLEGRSWIPFMNNRA